MLKLKFLFCEDKMYIIYCEILKNYEIFSI